MQGLHKLSRLRNINLPLGSQWQLFMILLPYEGHSSFSYCISWNSFSPHLTVQINHSFQLNKCTMFTLNYYIIQMWQNASSVQIWNVKCLLVYGSIIVFKWAHKKQGYIKPVYFMTLDKSVIGFLYASLGKLLRYHQGKPFPLQYQEHLLNIPLKLTDRLGWTVWHREREL